MGMGKGSFSLLLFSLIIVQGEFFYPVEEGFVTSPGVVKEPHTASSLNTQRNKKAAVATICIEINPGRNGEEPYYMCKRRGLEQQPSGNYYGSDSQSQGYSSPGKMEYPHKYPNNIPYSSQQKYHPGSNKVPIGTYGSASTYQSGNIFHPGSQTQQSQNLNSGHGDSFLRSKDPYYGGIDQITPNQLYVGAGFSEPSTIFAQPFDDTQLTTGDVYHRDFNHHHRTSPGHSQYDPEQQFGSKGLANVNQRPVGPTEANSHPLSDLDHHKHHGHAVSWPNIFSHHRNNFPQIHHSPYHQQGYVPYPLILPPVFAMPQQYCPSLQQQFTCPTSQLQHSSRQDYVASEQYENPNNGRNQPAPKHQTVQSEGKQPSEDFQRQHHRLHSGHREPDQPTRVELPSSLQHQNGRNEYPQIDNSDQQKGSFGPQAQNQEYSNGGTSSNYGQPQEIDDSSNPDYKPEQQKPGSLMRMNQTMRNHTKSVDLASNAADLSPLSSSDASAGEAKTIKGKSIYSHMPKWA